MYQLTVKWSHQDVMTRTIQTSNELSNLISSLRKGVMYASIVTPSGVTKDITRYFG